MRPLSRILMSLLIAATLRATASGQIRFWLSDTAQSSAAPGPGASIAIDRPLGAPGMVHVWAQPEAGKSLANFSLNLVSDSETVLQLDDVEVHNELDGENRRFEFIVDSYQTPDVSTVLDAPCIFDFEVELPTHAMWGFRGFTVADEVGSGLDPGTADADPGFDDVNNTWLLASIGYTPTELGSANLFLQIGEIGMNQANGDSSELFARFGSASDAALNAKSQRCVSSATSDASIQVIEPIVGDFNHNGMLDAGDIDLLSTEAANETHVEAFNLSGDALVNNVDRTFWVEDLKGTFFGDADLDGTVAFNDFLTLSANFGQSGGWLAGDFSGNHEVDFSDFLQLSSNFGASQAALAAAVVPEPMGLDVVAGLFFLVCVLRRVTDHRQDGRNMAFSPSV